MNSRLVGYGVEIETDWLKVAQPKPNARAKPSDESWEKASFRENVSCDSVGLSASISTQVEVLSTFIRIVDDKDTKTLAVAASRVRETELLAEARLRYALNQEGRSNRAPHAPAWFALKEENLAGCNPAATSATGELLSELALAVKIDASTVDLEPGPDGTVIVSFGDGIRWIVYAPRLPWPGCDVRFYAPENPSDYRLQAEHHRHVEPLMESTVRHLGSNGR